MSERPSPRITPRTLKGFRDFLPDDAALREQLIGTARAVFRSHGYRPIETPALEYTEILLGKGGAESDKQLYRFEDQGGRDVALRFDLTVPLARFVAQHVGTLGTPFKRYHVGTVWRGENTQRGRYREFTQFDFDIIGSESSVVDAETIIVVVELFRALGFEQFTVHVNNRRVLSGLLETLDLTDSSVGVLRALDKLQKIGADGVTQELATVGVGASQAEAILEFAATGGAAGDVLSALRTLVGESGTGRRGVEELEAVLSGVGAAGVADRVAIDVSIARGLDYYTGTVFETTLDDLPGIGSVCSGGRYDDLASTYTSQRLPGIGGSLGVDRLAAAMEELGSIDARRDGVDVLLAFFSEGHRDDYLALAATLRRGGLSVDFYPEPRKLGAQLKYADRKGHRLAVIVGDTEWEAGTAQVKALASGQTETVDLADLVAACRRMTV